LLFGDEQGSAQNMMPATIGSGGALEPATAADAANVQRTAYEPYGARRGQDLTAINRGWLGQVEDAGTGLTYLNARYYDPAIGRFLSPDPLMDPGDPRTLDPYRYADNNPVVYTDRTGLRPDCSGLSGDALRGCRDGYKGTTGTYDPSPRPKASNGGGGGGGSKAPLPDDVCFQFGSPCFDAGAAKVFQEQQALVGNYVDPWANRTCNPNGWCDSGGMYHSAPPASAQEVQALLLFMLAYVGGMACLAMLPECALGAAEFFATGGAGLGLTITGAGAATFGTSATALESSVGSGSARFITTTAGVTVDRASVGQTISFQRQARHILGSREYIGGGYFTSIDDATRVLDAFHNGNAQLLGISSSGNIVVRVPGVTGYNNNPGAGFANQPTDVFMIKGTSSVSVVPISPKWVP
jgi:RHS repeat-associated protein